MYRRARKRRRAVGQVAPLLEAAQAQLAYLQEVEWNLEANLGADANAEALREIQVCSPASVHRCDYSSGGRSSLAHSRAVCCLAHACNQLIC